MSVELLASKILIQEVNPSVPGLPPVNSAVLAAFGKAQRGPLNVPTLVTSFDQYTSTFGGFVSGFELPLAMRAYFLNGGTTAYVVRAGGSGGVAGTSVLPDSIAATTLTITANSVGVWGNAVSIVITAASDGVTNDYNLQVEVNGFVVETWANLSNASSTAANYASTVINNPTTGSNYITVAVNKTTRPVNTAGVTLSTGADPTVTDTELQAAILTYNTVNTITMMICPDGADTTVRNAMTTYSEITRNRQIFNIFDPPAATNTAGMVTDVGSLTASETWALYWPRVRIPNPDTTVYGTTVPMVTQCYSGFVAGICARNDATRQVGPFSNPAGIEDGIAYGLVDLESTAVLDESNRDIVFPLRINPVIYTQSLGFYADGARTGLGTSNFPSIGERRGVSTIEFQLKNALLFAKNKPNTSALRDRVYRTIVSVIMPYVNAGALASTDPSKAFFVDVSDALNTPDVQAAGQLLARVGIATAKPAEFIIVYVSQDQHSIQVSTLNAANSGS